jgi:hypothetical protein
LEKFRAECLEELRNLTGSRESLCGIRGNPGQSSSLSEWIHPIESQDAIRGTKAIFYTHMVADMTAGIAWITVIM